MALSRSRRYTVRALLVAATVLAVVGVFAVWTNRQVLNPTNWSDTSSALLEDPAIRTQIANELVDQVYANVDVKGEIARGLPPRLAPLAGPAAGGLRTAAERVADEALQRPRVQQAWQTANRATAQQFIDIVEGDSKAISRNGDAVILDLRVVLLDLTQRLGLPASVVNRIPPTAGRIKIMSGDQVGTVHNAVTTVRALAVVLPALALALLALAVYLATGRRRQTVLLAGVCLVIAGVTVLIARHLAGDAVVNALAKANAVEPAAGDAWSIGTRMLQDIAQATVVLGIPLILAALLAGATAPAVALRRRMAPTLRDRPGLAYGVAAAVVLLIVAWGPIHATRLVVPVLLFFALTMLGVAALRRQTAEEFPEAAPAAAGTSPQARFARARESAGETHVRELERLSTLHDRGALTDEEFAAEKAAVLANGAAR